MKTFKLRPGTVIFYVTLAFVVLVLIIGTLSMKKGIVAMLEDYENSQPKYTVEKIFNDYFKDPEFDVLLSMCEEKPTLKEPDTIDSFIKMLSDNVEGKEITYSYVAGTERKTVNVKADGVKFARFSIKALEKTTEYGNPIYTLDKIKLYYDTPALEFSFKVPTGYTVTVGGIPLGEEHITESDIVEDRRFTVPDGAYLFTSYRMKIDGLYFTPDFKCYDNKGNTVELVYDEENGEYVRSWEFDTVLQSEMSEYVLEAAYAYAAYMQDDMRFSAIKGYFDSSSELYDRIYENPNSFVMEHTGYGFEDGEATEFFKYDTGVISCRVKFTHVLTKTNKEDYKDYVDLTLYLREIDGVYKIYEMVTN